MMTMFNQAPPRWHLAVALIGAVAIEVAAVAAAQVRKDSAIPIDYGVTADPAVLLVLTDDPPEPVPPPDIPPPMPPPPMVETEFVLAEPSPPPVRLPVTKWRPRVAPTVARASRAVAGTVRFEAGQSKMTFSPHPGYPYEARRAKQTGSGKFLLRFEGNGAVREVVTVQSTGSPLLDEVAVRALRQWRCRPGVYESVFVPITFTLGGVQV